MTPPTESELLQLIDSHCHLHDSEFYPDGREEVYRR